MMRGLGNLTDLQKQLQERVEYLTKKLDEQARHMDALNSTIMTLNQNLLDISRKLDMKR